MIVADLNYFLYCTLELSRIPIPVFTISISTALLIFKLSHLLIPYFISSFTSGSGSRKLICFIIFG